MPGTLLARAVRGKLGSAGSSGGSLGDTVEVAAAVLEIVLAVVLAAAVVAVVTVVEVAVLAGSHGQLGLHWGLGSPPQWEPLGSTKSRERARGVGYCC